MTSEEKILIQAEVVQFLQSTAEDQKTLLLDVLLSGDGHALVHHILSTRAAYAQRRADALNYLLRAMTAEHPLSAPQAPAEPPQPVPRVPMPQGV